MQLTIFLIFSSISAYKIISKKQKIHLIQGTTSSKLISKYFRQDSKMIIVLDVLLYSFIVLT